MKRVYIISHGGVARDWTYTLSEALRSPALPQGLVWQQVEPERWYAKSPRRALGYEITLAEMRDVVRAREWLVSAW